MIAFAWFLYLLPLCELAMVGNYPPNHKLDFDRYFKQMYYDFYRKFFWLLSIERQ